MLVDLGPFRPDTLYTSETLVAFASKRTRFTTYQYASFVRRNRPTRPLEPAGGELGLARKHTPSPYSSKSHGAVVVLDANVV